MRTFPIHRGNTDATMIRWTSLILVVVSFSARAGTLTTRDGQTLKGDLSLVGDGQIVIRPGSGGEPRTIPFTEVQEATFAEAPEASTTYGELRAEKHRRVPHNVFAEYFADRDLTQRTLARYESYLNNAYWEVMNPPDPSIPAERFCCRYTTQLVPEFGEEYTITVETQGPFRLFIDGKPKLDAWAARGQLRQSTTVPMTAKKPINVRLEVTSGDYAYMARLTWQSKSVTNPWIGAESFRAPSDAPPAPAVTIASPADESHYLSPPSIVFEANATEQGARVARVDFIQDNKTILGFAERAPYKVEWDAPPAGSFRVLARATSDRGVSAYSDGVDVSIADAGPNRTLPKPWGQQTVREKKEPTPEGTSTFENGTFKLTKAGGQVTENDDALHMVYQPVSGDFEIVARVASVAPANDNQVGPLGGIMIRDTMNRGARAASLVVGPGMTHFVRKTGYWDKVSVSAKEDAPAPIWLKLLRHGTRVRAYTSNDGAAWTLLGADKVDLPERVFVGVCAMSRNRQTPAVATFDHVSLSPGPPAMLHTVEGLLFKSGSFLACEVHGIKDGSVSYTRGGKRAYRPATDVARLVYRAVPAELAENLPPDRTGALLGSGDFIEGELKDVNYRVTVSNLVFGPRTFNIKTNDVLALYLKDPDVPTLPYALTAGDGSVYQSKTIKLTNDMISIEDPTLGPIQLPKKDLVQFRCR
jgi:regulation of enolase protein 1 (concanavalin A-like superfamily)